MNQLQFEISPYLLQHKDNPVDWFPWGEKAFEKARAEDKPILLSIGYSACHWCHVMAHESFENVAIAKLMNDNFINIKVDREERPDVDNIYMNYVNLAAGSGGWPLTVFLTPYLIPFFGGTYFPPEERYGRPGFPDILKNISSIYKNKKDEILSNKENIVQALLESYPEFKNISEIYEQDFDRAFENICKQYDDEYGGFGLAPKFPHTMTLTFLLDYYYKTENNVALKIVETSLQKMAKGGMYDQIGGGFHRYSTDNNWLVPHFEKMLYDNALLSKLYLNAFRVTRNNFYLKIAEDLLEYILREMTDSSGGFYSSQDADSEGIEGKFYVWGWNELEQNLFEYEFQIAVDYFGVIREGNFEGKNILTASKTIIELSNNYRLTDNKIEETIETIKKKLFQLRDKKIKPGLDNKMLTSWNALMLDAFCLAYTITGKEQYKNVVLKSSEFIWGKCFKDNVLFHSYNNGKLKNKGFLDDYTLSAKAFVSVYNATFNEKWLDRAKILTELILKYFYDEKTRDFYFSNKGSKDLIVRVKEIYDNATPSGSSVAVEVLSKLGVYLNKKIYLDIADKYIGKHSELIIKYPLNFSYLLDVALYRFMLPKEVAFITSTDVNNDNLILEFNKKYYPFTILCAKNYKDKTSLELLKDKNLINNETTIYVCENFKCNSPVKTLENLEALLGK